MVVHTSLSTSKSGQSVRSVSWKNVASHKRLHETLHVTFLFVEFVNWNTKGCLQKLYIVNLGRQRGIAVKYQANTL